LIVEQYDGTRRSIVSALDEDFQSKISVKKEM
jgi:hypothetical protein